MSAEEQITADDLLEALSAADALETFIHLPTSSQDEFRSWIGRARDDDSHWRRIEAFVSAMRGGS